MRSVTVVRVENSVAPNGVFEVYAEDANAFDATIEGVNCRKVGTLINGGSAVFETGNEAQRIFIVLAGTETFPETYLLPEGETDVTLTGECCFDPSAGVVFRFDANREAAKTVSAGRRKGSAAAILIFVIVAILSASVAGAAVKCFMNRGNASGAGEASSAAYTVRDMQITLTDAFQKVADDDTDASFESNTCGVYVLRDAFADYEGIADWTLNDYADAVLSEDMERKEADGVLYIEYDYTDEETKESFYYLVSLYKGPDAFWMVTFATFRENAIRLRPSFLQWAKSVTFQN